MYPGRYARDTPDKPAVVMAGSGESVTYLQLDRRSNRLARLWYAQGLRCGDHVAISWRTQPRYFDVYWAAIRSGLYLTTVNRYLSAEEAAYIVKDCGARSIVASAKLAEACDQLTGLIPTCPDRLMVDDDKLGCPPGWTTTARRRPGSRPNRSRSSRAAAPCSTARAQPAARRDPAAADGSVGGGDAGPAVRGAHQRLRQSTPIRSTFRRRPSTHAAPIGFTGGTQTLGGSRRRDGAVRPGAFAQGDRGLRDHGEPVGAGRCSTACSSCRRTCGRGTTCQATSGRFTPPLRARSTSSVG